MQYITKYPKTTEVKRKKIQTITATTTIIPMINDSQTSNEWRWKYKDRKIIIKQGKKKIDLSQRYWFPMMNFFSADRKKNHQTIISWIESWWLWWRIEHFDARKKTEKKKKRRSWKYKRTHTHTWKIICEWKTFDFIYPFNKSEFVFLGLMEGLENGTNRLDS